MTWVVEPNAVGGWDLRPDGGAARQGRYPSRADAVAEANRLGGEIVVRGPRGDVLERLNAPPARVATVARPSVSEAPPPSAGRRPGMRLGQILSLTDQTDETGRLLLEDSAPPPAIRRAEQAGISMATVEATYADTPSRLGGQMNAAAYDALRHDTAAILDGFAWLARHHQHAAPDEVGTPRRLYAVSYLGISLVHLLFHRADDPVPAHGRLPSFIASIFKASRGVFSFSVAMENDRGPDVVMTAAEVVRYAEETRQLVRPQTGRVCAAPTRLIERTLEVVLSGEGADAERSSLDGLVDFDPLWSFYRLQDDFGRLLSSFGAVFQAVAESAGPAVANDPRRLFRTRLPAGPAQGQTLGDYTEGVLREANAVQAGLNRALGRAENAARIGLEELVRML